MHRLISRTSITIDEAVAILLGRITGPTDFEPKDDSEEAEANCPAFCLQEFLEDELEVLRGEYLLAKHEKLEAHVIAEKLAALQNQKDAIQQANLHLSAIKDELNKGRSSKLKVDRALSNAAYTYITLHSFNEWVKRKESVSKGPGAAVLAESVPAPVVSSKKKVPRTKGLRQQDAILEEIDKQGHDPKDLPPNPVGQRGVKNDVRKAVEKTPLFDTKSAFKRAWDELNARDLIAYRPRPSSPKKVAGGDL